MKKIAYYGTERHEDYDDDNGNDNGDDDDSNDDVL